MGSGDAIPASTTKLLTSAAALETLGPEHTFSTRVVAGGRGRIVLVGGGDPFLMSEPVGRTGRSTRARGRRDPRRADRPGAAAAGPPARGLGFDDSLFTGPAVNPHWPAAYVADDVVSPITALWVDEGREPDSFDRVDDPSLYAAQVFAAALSPPASRSSATRRRHRPRRGREIAAVTSAPLREIVEQTLEVSDNEAAEVLAHHVGLAVRGTGSFADGVLGTMKTLRRLGVPDRRHRDVRRQRAVPRQPDHSRDPARGAPGGGHRRARAARGGRPGCPSPASPAR